MRLIASHSAAVGLTKAVPSSSAVPCDRAGMDGGQAEGKERQAVVSIITLTRWVVHVHNWNFVRQPRSSFAWSTCVFFASVGQGEVNRSAVAKVADVEERKRLLSWICVMD